MGLEKTDELLNKTQSVSDALDAMGVESKDIDTSVEVTEDTSSEPVVEEAVEPEAEVEVAIEVELTEEDDSAVVDDEEVMSEPVSALVEAITEDVTKSLHIEDLNALLTEVLTSHKEILARMDELEVADEVKVNAGIVKEMGQPVWAGFKASEDETTLLGNVLADGEKAPKGPKMTDKPDDAVDTLMKFVEGSGLGIFDRGN